MQKNKFGENFASEFDKYLDDYYNVDYEDIVGGTPVKFKYEKVNPNDYGVTVTDILSRDDRELNQIVSLKRLYPYREDTDNPYKRRKKNNNNRKKNNNNRKKNWNNQT